MNRSRKRPLLCLTAAIPVLALIGLIIYLKSVSDYKQAVRDIRFSSIDITEIADATYIGECNVNFIYARVAVVVHNGQITDIQILEHQNDRGKPAENVIDKIIKEQRIDVDAVSGATNSSIVLKKAVENAILK